MKSPAFQFYPGDWRRDTALQVCSISARGLWAEMLFLMHDGEPYGHLATPDGPMSLRTLASLVHAPLKLVTSKLGELERHGVFSRTSAGVIFSRRMVRDVTLRAKRAAGGVKSLEHPNVPRPRRISFVDPHEGRAEGSNAVGSPASASASASAKRRTTPDSEGSRPLDSERNGLEELHEQETQASREAFQTLVAKVSERMGFQP